MPAPKMPQENYMAVGSAFDAYVKSHLFQCVYGLGADPAFEFETIFESQVEPQNRDWGREHGKYIFDCYERCGVLNELLTMFATAEKAPRFEFTVSQEIGTVPLLGKPDLQLVAKGGVHVILDFKVKGYCSKSATSPSKDYLFCRDAFDTTIHKQTRGGDGPHKNFLPYNHKGMTIHAGYMEYSNREYADQLALYSWLLGENVGDEQVVVGIDEIVAKPSEPYPLLRVAQHRSRVSAAHQHALLERFQAAWRAIQSGYIFTNMTRAESDEQCELLNMSAAGLQPDGTALQDWFNQTVRAKFRAGIGTEAATLPTTRRR
jgi:hypothetical protein